MIKTIKGFLQRDGLDWHRFNSRIIDVFMWAIYLIGILIGFLIAVILFKIAF